MNKRFLVILLSLGLSCGADPPAANHPAASPLFGVREGSYSREAAPRPQPAILNWNINKGKQMSRVLEAIRDTRSDICIFQEVDLGARRTKGQNVTEQLAKAAEMNYAFGVEFEELSQGTAEGPALHGQATLSRMPIRSVRVLRFAHQSGFWKPRPLFVPDLPIFQRREGGRIALVTELNNGGKTLVIYNLHLESRGGEHLRLQQIEEVLADAARYSADVPVILAGDLNTKSWSSPVIPRLRKSGFQSAFGNRRVRTHKIIGSLDWVFVRGPVEFEKARVIRDLHASDHDPILAEVRLEGAS